MGKNVLADSGADDYELVCGIIYTRIQLEEYGVGKEDEIIAAIQNEMEETVRKQLE
jgi:hypothetical protein